MCKVSNFLDGILAKLVQTRISTQMAMKHFADQAAVTMEQVFTHAWSLAASPQFWGLRASHLLLPNREQLLPQSGVFCNPSVQPWS